MYLKQDSNLASTVRRNILIITQIQSYVWQKGNIYNACKFM